MKAEFTNTSAMKHARTAGMLYLVIIICGLFSEMYVRGSIIVPGDATATTNNILSHSGLFRLGMVSDLVMVLCDVGVGVLFYILLRPVNKTLALLAAFLRLGQATIIALNLLNYFTALQVATGSVTAFNTGQTETLVAMFLDMHKHGYLISGVLFALSCAALGYLFYRSAYFPKVFGIMLAMAAAGYTVNCLAHFAAPQFIAASELLLLPTAVVTELSLCFWLLFKGIKKQHLSPAFG